MSNKFQEMQERYRLFNEQQSQSQQVYDLFSGKPENSMGNIGMGLNGKAIDGYIPSLTGGLESEKFPGGMQNGVETVQTQQNRAADLGDNSMDLKTKFSVGLGIAQTGMSAYLGFQQNKLAKKQFGESKRQFNTNLGMQKSIMSGNLKQQYNTAQNPEMLASSRDEYLKGYGLS